MDNLCKILKGHENDIFYTTTFGNVTLSNVSDKYITIMVGKEEKMLTEQGKYNANGECIIFPSRTDRDWDEWARKHDPETSVIDRVRTFEDALKELKPDHPLRKQWENSCPVLRHPNDKSLIAFMKLRIICEALNQGWKPKYSDNEKRCDPAFLVCSDDWEEEESEDERIIKFNESKMLSCNSADFYLSSSYDSVYTPFSFRNSELGFYCAKHFLEIWRDYISLNIMKIEISELELGDVFEYKNVIYEVVRKGRWTSYCKYENDKYLKESWVKYLYCSFSNYTKVNV